MADLLKEYFKRDLTDAEERKLADQLAASPKDSLRFARMAHQAYLRTGLPDAGGSHGPGTGGLPHGLGPTGPAVLKGVIVAATLSTGAYLMVHSLSGHPAPPAPLPAVAPPALSQPAPPKSPAHGIAPRSSRPAAPVKALAKPGMVQPVAYDPSQQYEGLDLIVDQKAAGLVTVRVLDPADREVRLLFAGMLASGKWDFLWDGKMDDGQLAQPGTYRVEVQSGQEILSKAVDIQGETHGPK